jgi:hypothetical protein
MRRGKPSLRRWDITFLATRFTLLAALALTGCSTISPNPTTPQAPSVGLNGQHSDIYAVTYTPSRSIKTQTWYERKREIYNGMIDLYGKDRVFLKPLTHDYHLTPDGPYWVADDEAITDFIELNRIRASTVNP